jgi:hypothetical protein
MCKLIAGPSQQILQFYGFTIVQILQFYGFTIVQILQFYGFLGSLQW